MPRESFFTRWRNYQLSRLELVFSVVVLLVLVSVFLNYMIIMMARAERSMVEASIVNLNSALRVQAMQIYMNDGPTALDRLQHANPVTLLEQRTDWQPGETFDAVQMATLAGVRSQAALPGYAGAMTAEQAADLESGSWYYDTGAGALVYLVRNTEMFRSELPGRARLRYRLEVDAGDDRARHVVLESLDEYQWLF